MADDADGLGLLKEGVDEVHSVLFGTQRVRSYGAARYDQAVVLVRGDLGERLLHRESLPGVHVAVHGLGVARLDANDVDRSAFGLHGLLRLGKFDLLRPTGARRIAIFLPCNSLATNEILSICLHHRNTRPERTLNEHAPAFGLRLSARRFAPCQHARACALACQHASASPRCQLYPVAAWPIRSQGTGAGGR